MAAAGCWKPCAGSTSRSRPACLPGADDRLDHCRHRGIQRIAHASPLPTAAATRNVSPASASSRKSAPSSRPACAGPKARTLAPQRSQHPALPSGGGADQASLNNLPSHSSTHLRGFRMNTVKQWMRATRPRFRTRAGGRSGQGDRRVAERRRGHTGRSGQHLAVLRQCPQPEPDRLQRVIQRFSAALRHHQRQPGHQSVAIRAIASSSQPPARSGMPRRTADVIHSDHGRRSARPLRSLSMSTEGTARSPLILADGYSYTELIPCRTALPASSASSTPSSARRKKHPSPRWRRTTRRLPHRNRAEDRHHAQPGSHSTVPPTDAGSGRHGLRHAGQAPDDHRHGHLRRSPHLPASPDRTGLCLRADYPRGGGQQRLPRTARTAHQPLARPGAHHPAGAEHRLGQRLCGRPAGRARRKRRIPVDDG